MKLSTFLRSSVMTFIFVLSSFIGIQAQTTAFTYQGRLTDASMPATNGTYDFEFALFSADSGGTQISTTQSISGVTVNNGVFNIQLDFGAPSFSGADRYLEIRVKKPTDASYITLSPRQRITSTPYSIRSLNAGTAETATNATNAANANNADKLDNIDSSSFVQTNTTAFIRNQTTQLESASFNISGTGKANNFDAATQYKIGGERVLSVSGNSNLFVGAGVGASNTGSGNSFVGYNAGNKNTSGNGNSFFGTSAGNSNTTGVLNSFFGTDAGQSNTEGNFNSFFGYSAGASASGSSDNSFFGTFAGVYTIVGGNSFFGSYAGFSNSSGTSNSFFGADAGYSNTEGSVNVFFGNNAGMYNTTSSGNSFVGGGAGLFSEGSNNTFFGANTGRANKTGNNNTLIGYNVNVASDNLTHATAIGAEAIVFSSNTIVLGRVTGFDKVITPGLVQLNKLGVAGSTHLCRNALDEISTCSAQATLAENNVNNVNAATINTLREQVKQQQQQIDALIKLVCSQNTKADVCKQEK